MVPFKFSKYIGVPVLSEWTVLKDVMHLTIAVCRQQRLQLTNWLSEFSMAFSKSLFSDKEYFLIPEILTWCSSYNIDYSKVLFHLKDDYNMVASLRKIPDACKSIKRLYSDTNFDLNVNLIDNIEELHLIDIALTIKNLSVFSKLRCCELEYYYLNDKVIVLSRNCPELTSLTLCCEKYIGMVAMQSLVIYSRKLKLLNMQKIIVESKSWKLFKVHFKSNLTSLTSPAHSLVSSDLLYLGAKLESLYCAVEDPLEFARLCPNLTSLGYSLMSFGIDQSVLIKGLRALVHFECSYDYQGIDSNLLELTTNCTALQSLCLYQYGPQLPNETIASIAKLRNLTKLAIPLNPMTDDQLITIAQGCPYLSDVNLDHNKTLTDRSFVIFAKCCKFLQKLTIPRTSIGNSGLIALSVNCKRLWNLDISECYEVCDIGVLELKWLPLRVVRFQGLAITGNLSLETKVFLHSINEANKV